ncbi:conjugal transfer protein [Bartonella sp. CB60]|uniref:conjugal transfer protein n=1 Tax=Bartonella sp. CB60 TaxID=3113619 RepID=UPI003FA5E12F
MVIPIIMKCLNTLQAKFNSKIGIAFMATVLFLATQSAYIQAKTNKTDIQTTIDKANLLMGMRYGLSMFIPVVAGVILLFLLLIYACRIIARTTFARWAFSTIIAGAAFYLSNILFYIN